MLRNFCKTFMKSRINGCVLFIRNKHSISFFKDIFFYTDFTLYDLSYLKIAIWEKIYRILSFDGNDVLKKETS